MESRQPGDSPKSEQSAIENAMNGCYARPFLTATLRNIPIMAIPLSDQDQLTLRLAGWGAVSLMSAAGAARLGPQGRHQRLHRPGFRHRSERHVLVKAPKSLTGKTVATLADQVLPALTTSINLRKQQAPEEADNFRRPVTVAVESQKASPARP
ncbi:hypothetical protein [Nonomuraea sp. NPDC049646]|uniref:hypothetical protein n=1 Tax=unclassified Nonomuraea TaxID=2593643 RepID=UPI00378A68AB